MHISMSKSGTDTVYISLPGHPPAGQSAGCVKEMIRLDEVLKDHDMPMVNLDFDNDGKLIGIEVVL